MDVVSDSGEDDIRVRRDGLADFADLAVQKRFTDPTARQIFVTKSDGDKNTGTVTRKQSTDRKGPPNSMTELYVTPALK